MSDVPQPVPSHIPWYKSATTRFILVFIVTSVSAFAVRRGWITAAPDVTTLVDSILEAVSVLAGGLAIQARVTKPMPVITLTQAKADELSAKPTTLNAPGTKVQAHPFAVVIALLLLFGMMCCSALSGCKGSGFDAGQTIEQKAGGLLGDFATYQQASLAIGKDETVPAAVRVGVLTAAKKAKLAADSMQDALEEYGTAKGELALGKTTQDQVNIASTHLLEWIAEVRPLVAKMKTAVEEVTK